MRLEMGRTGEQRSPKVHINPTLDFSGPQSFTEVPAWTFFQAYFTLPTFLNKIASVCYFLPAVFLLASDLKANLSWAIQGLITDSHNTAI